MIRMRVPFSSITEVWENNFLPGNTIMGRLYEKWIAIFSNFPKLFIYWYKPVESSEFFRLRFRFINYGFDICSFYSF